MTRTRTCRLAAEGVELVGQPEPEIQGWERARGLAPDSAPVVLHALRLHGLGREGEAQRSRREALEKSPSRLAAVKLQRSLPGPDP